MAEYHSRLALGTANFGLNYGINNKAGKLAKSEIDKIVEIASSSGISAIDTAQAYGDSETRIGAIGNHKFHIITKFSSQDYHNISKSSIKASIMKSMKNLKTQKLYGLLVHHPEILLGPDSREIIRSLRELKEDGLVEKIGLSIYEPNILNELFNNFDFDLIQVPFNVFDHRIMSSGWVDKLKESSVEIHARSVFLQGLLLKESHQVNDYFYKNWKTLFDTWFYLQKKENKSASMLALEHVISQKWVDKIVVGVDDANQLKSLLKIEKQSGHTNLEGLTCADKRLVNPSNWQLPMGT